MFCFVCRRRRKNCDSTFATATEDGFHLTKWSSHNLFVLQAVPGPEHSTQLLNFDLDNHFIERVLGIRWNIKKDVFEFRVNIPPHSLLAEAFCRLLAFCMIL